MPRDPTRPPGETLVELRTGGGIDGRGIGGLVVSGTGALRRTDPEGRVEDGTLAPGEVDDLADLLEEIDFGTVPPEPDRDQICADGLSYGVVYQQWEVVADDCSVPTEIEPVLNRLRELMARFD